MPPIVFEVVMALDAHLVGSWEFRHPNEVDTFFSVLAPQWATTEWLAKVRGQLLVDYTRERAKYKSKYIEGYGLKYKDENDRWLFVIADYSAKNATPDSATSPVSFKEKE